MFTDTQIKKIKNYFIICILIGLIIGIRAGYRSGKKIKPKPLKRK